MLFPHAKNEGMLSWVVIIVKIVRHYEDIKLLGDVFDVLARIRKISVKTIFKADPQVFLFII